MLWRSSEHKVHGDNRLESQIERKGSPSSKTLVFHREEKVPSGELAKLGFTIPAM